jgi:chitinase
VCGSYYFGAPLDARVSGVQYDTEHILEYQLPGMFLQELDQQIFDHIFDHPNPSQLDSNGRPKKISFCEYVKELWTIPAIAIAGNTKSPADHISDCYPTANRYSEELVVLQHRINTPAKGKVR